MECENKFKSRKKTQITQYYNQGMIRTRNGVFDEGCASLESGISVTSLLNL